MKVLVTGGAGFIGSHLVHRLVRDGHAVTVLDNLTTGRAENLAEVAGDVDLRVADLRDADALASAAQGAEVVFHQAAKTSVPGSVEAPREVTEINVNGTLNVILAARDAKVRRIVFASSSSVYGDTPTLPKTESMVLTPRSPYASSKLAGEAYLSAGQACYGVEGVSLRYFNVYGPRQSPKSRYAAAVPMFMTAMLAGRPPTVYGDGGQSRDFTFVEDVVDALLRAATAPKAVEGPMNVGGGHRVVINDLVKAIAAATGYQGSAVHAAPRAGDVRDSLADVAQARERLGWRPATTIEEGIARTVAWARSPQGRAFLA